MPIPRVLLTIDVEDWFQVENFKQSVPFSSWSSRESRVEENTHRLLDLFDSIETGSLSQSSVPSHEPSATSDELDGECHPKATFFILGWLAERCPQLVREIHSRGHEVASHGLYHNLPGECSIADYETDLLDSRKLLEDTIGGGVYGYRTPSFAIDDDILKTIEDCGYLYDSSYNSFDAHGRYGRLSRTGREKKGIALQISPEFHELPVSNMDVMNHVLPWGGGGYFRLMPFFLFRLGVASILKQDDAYLFYMHPWEIDPDQPRVHGAPLSYRFRHYVNLKSTYRKLAKLVNSFKHCRFTTCHQYLNSIV